MILAIDIGNSNIVLGGLEGDAITFEARMATDQIKTSDQYCADLKSMLSLFGVDPVSLEGSIISSVVPPVMASVCEALERLPSGSEDRAEAGRQRWPRLSEEERG